MSEITETPESTIVKPDQDIVASATEEFKKELSAVVSWNPKVISVDLGDVEMVDSMGLAVFIATHNSLKQKGGELRVFNASEEITNLFKMMHLDRYFEVEGK